MFTMGTANRYEFGVLDPATQRVQWGVAQGCDRSDRLQGIAQAVASLYPRLPVVVTRDGVLYAVYADELDRRARLYADAHALDLRFF